MIKLILQTFLPAFLLLLPCASFAQFRWMTDEGAIRFESDAPLELIQAGSKALRGVIQPADKTFAFTVQVASFQGFNSSLQREHFKENYLESDKYPEATFTGRIIDDVDLTRPGTYTIRAKGALVIHGVSRERIIRSEVVVEEKSCRVKSRFTVLLDDHDIAIPKVVHQKIAEEISVEVEAVFNKK